MLKDDKAIISTGDLSGKQVYRNTVSIVINSNTFNIDLIRIAKGAYTMPTYVVILCEKIFKAIKPSSGSVIWLEPLSAV